jgi:DNA-binding ferritin-like protein
MTYISKHENSIGVGESFMEKYKLFENQYKQLEESIDEIAERINKLGKKQLEPRPSSLEYQP